MGDPIALEPAALERLHFLFLEHVQYHHTSKVPREVLKSDVRVQFLYNGVNYSGDFKLSSVGEIIRGTKLCSVLRFDNNCSFLSYQYAIPAPPYRPPYPYRSKIQANKGNVDEGYIPCFTPQLDIPRGSADVLQILSTKIRLQIPGHRAITIVDEAEKDGLYISKAKLVRGMPSIYEKYGYESDVVDDIRDQILASHIRMLNSAQLMGLLEKALGRKIQGDELIVDVMKQIPPGKENVSYHDEVMEFNDESDFFMIRREEESHKTYLSNIVYDKLAQYFHFYPLFLTFNENSEAWKGIKNQVLITSVEEISREGENMTMKNNYGGGRRGGQCAGRRKTKKGVLRRKGKKGKTCRKKGHK
jgi:hypothetical protein